MLVETAPLLLQDGAPSVEYLVVVRIVERIAGRSEVCEAILRQLPSWFGIESAIVEYVARVEALPMFVVEQGDRCVGFVSLLPQTSATLEIYVMGVVPDQHRRGVGRALVAASIGYAAGAGYSLLSVKTLDESRASPEYERTRRFYTSMGFLPVEVFPSLWGEANPCLLSVRAVSVEH